MELVRVVRTMGKDHLLQHPLLMGKSRLHHHLLHRSLTIMKGGLVDVEWETRDSFRHQTAASPLTGWPTLLLQPLALGLRTEVATKETSFSG